MSSDKIRTSEVHYIQVVSMSFPTGTMIKVSSLGGRHVSTLDFSMYMIS